MVRPTVRTRSTQSMDGLTTVQLSWMGRNGRVLVGELASSLCCPVLGVGLPSAYSHLLLLLLNLLSLKRKPDVWPQRDGL
jgi:hypothetical protein